MKYAAAALTALAVALGGASSASADDTSAPTAAPSTSDVPHVQIVIPRGRY